MGFPRDPSSTITALQMYILQIVASRYESTIQSPKHFNEKSV